METTAGTTSEHAEQHQHPIRLVVNDDLQRNRLTVFFRLILAIPLILFMGRAPDGLHTFLASYLRFSTHARAYVLLIADPYPGFTGKAGSYPIDLEIDPPQPQNRLTVFFRIILALPALFLANIMSNLNQLLAIFSWFIALVLGRVPEGMRNFAALALRIEQQTYAYVMLLTGRYPSFNVGIQA